MKSALRQKKITLSENDDKRIIQDDDIHTFAHGHFGAHRSDGEKFQWSFEIEVDFKMYKNCTLKSTLILSSLQGS